MSLLSYCHPLMVLTSLAERVFAPEIFIHLKRLKASAASPQLRAEVCTAVNLPWLRKVGRPRAMPKLQSSGFLKSWTQKVGHKFVFSDAAQQASTSVPVALPSKLQTSKPMFDWFEPSTRITFLFKKFQITLWATDPKNVC